MEQNMDGENNHQKGEWEKHEIDRELVEQLDHLFDTNQRLFGAERHKEHSRWLISNLPERVRPSTLECTMHNYDARCLIKIHKLIRTPVFLNPVFLFCTSAWTKFQ